MVFDSENCLNHLLYLTFLEVRNGANLRNLASNNCKITNNNSSNNATVFYRFIGNFVPAEWKDLIGDNAKALSKTSKQLLSFYKYIRLHIYYNKRYR
ncbi:hypothetical protein OTSTA763_1093 [Orientia tsutsugamushi str. TA763]|nr:hypothetical protein OTSTA763_1093 [Orientia tsutsugamushi str. TA763]